MRRLSLLLCGLVLALLPVPAHANGGGSTDVAPTATASPANCTASDCVIRVHEFDVTDRTKTWVKEYHTASGIWTTSTESFGSSFVIAGNESETFFRYAIDNGGSLWCYQPSGPSQGWHLALNSVFLDVDAKRATPATVQNTGMNHYVAMLRSADDSVMLTPGLLVCGPNTPFSNIGGGTFWSPAVTQMSDGAHVAVTGTDGAVWQWAASVGWTSIGGGSTGAPAAVSWDAGSRLDVFARGTDNALWHRWWFGSGWSNWESLGGILSSGPGCTSWATGRLDCFVVGNDGTSIFHKWYTSGAWSDWENLG